MKLTITILISILISLNLLASDNTFQSDIDVVLKSPVDNGFTAGISITIMHNDSVIYSRGYGYADIESKTLMTDSTPLRAASVSKIITAFAALKLEQEDKLSLSDPLIKYLPELKNYIDSAITISHCLNHTSGLKDYLTADLDRFMKTNSDLTDEFVINYVQDNGSHFSPGELWSYSNTGFYLSALAMERATNLEWNEIVDKYISAPFNVDDLKFCDNLVISESLKGYKLESSLLVETNLYTEKGIIGDGGICTSSKDLAKFVYMLNSSSSYSSILTQMLQPVTLNNNVNIDYGTGVRLGALAGHKMWGHTGSFENYLAVAFCFPDDSITIAVLQNTINSGEDALITAWQTAEIVLQLEKPEIGIYTKTIPQNLYDGNYISWGESKEQVTCSIKSGEHLLFRSWDEFLSGVSDTLYPSALHNFKHKHWYRDYLDYHLNNDSVFGFSEYYAGMFANFYMKVK